MLRLCLNGRESARCPYCRASLVAREGPGDDEDIFEESDSDDDSIEEETERGTTDVGRAVVGPQLPQWMRLRWKPEDICDARTRRIQESVLKKMLSRASNKRAPEVLKRCSEEQTRLKKDLVSARAKARLCKSGKSRRTVRETLRVLKQQDALVQRAERRLQAHKRKVLLRCQKSQNVVDYFWLKPLADAM